MTEIWKDRKKVRLKDSKMERQLDGKTEGWKDGTTIRLKDRRQKNRITKRQKSGKKMK